MRSAGVLLPISSLPSPYGIGTLGRAAYDFVDFLTLAGQSLWQVLPVGPTGYGDSPYQSFSSFAGNPYFIDLDLLVGNGLLQTDEIGTDWGTDPMRVDYSLLFNKRFAVLARAVARQNKTAPKYLEFCAENRWWLEDYALYMAIKEAHGHHSFQDWPAPLRLREPEALKAAAAQWGPRVEFWRCVQFFFYTQWHALRSYANAQGISLVGDVPIYISPDSSDLWANPELFQVGPDGRPTVVAGVPPDAFSAEGQLWGNPLYNWPRHKRTRYAWWIRRMSYVDSLFDITRIDHFRGFDGYFAVPAGAKTAQTGCWEKGPGKDFIRALRRALPGIQIIAEDLGFLTESVFELLSYSGFPGMKVLQFAFDSRDESDYLPYNYPRHTVVYTGTHDNTTTEDWQYSALPEDVAFARRYLGIGPEHSLTDAIVAAALSSVGDTAIIPIQDWLHLGSEARINIPSTLGGHNWQWRLLQGQLTEELAAHLRLQTRTYGRLSQTERDKEGWAARIAQRRTRYGKILPSAEQKAEEQEMGMLPEMPLPGGDAQPGPEEQRAAVQAGIPSMGEQLLATGHLGEDGAFEAAEEEDGDITTPKEE